VSKVIKGDIAELLMTHMHHPKFIIITFSLLLLAFLFSNVMATSISIDKTATVSTVIDGSSFMINSGETVKLAGIETPPSGQPGYSEAKYYLTNMVQGKIVYLDIDNLATTDQYGRLISVGYIDYNSTHYENVNMAMIVNSYAIPISLNNSEFNPSSWTWFVPKDTPSPSPTSTSTPTAIPSVAPYSPPPTPSPSPIVPEFSALVPHSPSPTPSPSPIVLVFSALVGLIIISLAIVIFVKFHKKKS
jgi:endonuclease YncB( thermonuclease family)